MVNLRVKRPLLLLLNIHIFIPIRVTFNVRITGVLDGTGNVHISRGLLILLTPISAAIKISLFVF